MDLNGNFPLNFKELSSSETKIDDFATELFIARFLLVLCEILKLGLGYVSANMSSILVLGGLSRESVRYPVI